MPHCIYINVATKEITREEMPGGFTLERYHAMIQDSIQIGGVFPNGDIMYVDEEGIHRKPRAGWFLMGGIRFTGSAVVVRLNQVTGADLSPKSTVTAIKNAVRFLDDYVS